VTLNGLEKHHQILNSLMSRRVAIYSQLWLDRAYSRASGRSRRAPYGGLHVDSWRGRRRAEAVVHTEDRSGISMLNTHPLHSPKFLQDDLEDWCRNSQSVGGASQNKLLVMAWKSLLACRC